MRGRKPKPRAVKLLEGKPGKRKMHGELRIEDAELMVKEDGHGRTQTKKEKEKYRGKMPVSREGKKKSGKHGHGGRNGQGGRTRTNMASAVNATKRRISASIGGRKKRDTGKMPVIHGRDGRTRTNRGNAVNYEKGAKDNANSAKGGTTTIKDDLRTADEVRNGKTDEEE